MSDDEKGFKVNDRRHSASDSEKSPKEKNPKSGDGFTMKESETPDFDANRVDFSTFILSLSTGAIINLGLAPDPVTQKVEKNLELAKQNIEILSLISEKTKGNLTSEEKQLMQSLLTEVRLRFVEASK